jgi:hypothetical protein
MKLRFSQTKTVIWSILSNLALMKMVMLFSSLLMEKLQRNNGESLVLATVF